MFTTFKAHSQARRDMAFVALAFLLTGLAPMAQAGEKPPVRSGKGSPAAPLPAPAAARLAYQFVPGKSVRYKILLLLDGHFPPLSDASGPPIHIKADLNYVATVKKRDDKGIEVAYSIEAAHLALLMKEAGPDGSVAEANELPYDISLEQVQKMFNVTALLQPNGSIANVTGGSSPLRVEIGVDLRKLFVAIMPVVFPPTPLKIGDDWTFDEGFLGRKAGKTTYTGHLAAIHPGVSAFTFDVSQQAQTLIASKLDKEGNSTDNPADVVGALDGKVTATGAMQFVAPPNHPASDAPLIGKQSQGNLKLTIDLKKVMPDTEHPGQKIETPINGTGRLLVRALPDTAAAPKITATRPESRTGTAPMEPARGKK